MNTQKKEETVNVKDSVNFTLDVPSVGQITLEGSSNDQSIVQAIINTGTYEPDLMRQLNKMLKPGSAFLDLGANIGVVSAIASHFVGSSGLVISIEAGKTNFTYLEQNMKRSGLNNFRLFNYGVWDCETTMNFSYVPQVAGCSFFSTTGVQEGNLEVVQCRTVDSILSEMGWPRIDLVKIDVEGAELKALRGMDGTIAKFRPGIIFELNSGALKRFFDIEPKKIWDFFEERRYSLHDFIKDENLLKILTVDEFLDIAGENPWIELLAKPN